MAQKQESAYRELPAAQSPPRGHGHGSHSESDGLPFSPFLKGSNAASYPHLVPFCNALPAAPIHTQDLLQNSDSSQRGLFLILTMCLLRISVAHNFEFVTTMLRKNRKQRS